MPKKIIYVFERRHGYKYDVEMCEFDCFLKHGVEVEVWSAVNWTFEGIDVPLNEDKSGRTHYINNKDDLLFELNRVKNDGCVFLMYPYHSYSAISYTIRKYIKKYGFSFYNITESTSIEYSNYNLRIPFGFSTALKNEFINFLRIPYRFLRGLFSQKSRKIAKDLFLQFFGPIIYKSKKNFITTPLLYYSIPNKFETFSKRNIMLYSGSIDEYKIALTKDSGYKNFVVFIDQFSSGHSDFKKAGLTPPAADAQKYFSELNYLFAQIEKAYGCEVIIAAHPKAEYNGDEFEGRKIIHGKSNLLMKDAKLVIQQYSTTFGVITMLKKGFLNIYSQDFFVNMPNLKQQCYVPIQEMFNCKQLNISDKTEVQKFQEYITEYNEENFAAYRERYVISKNSVASEENGKLFYDYVYEEIVKDSAWREENNE